MSIALAVGESKVQGASTIDVSKPWTLLEDGRIKELGFKLNSHVTVQVQRDDMEGRRYRKLVADTNVKTIAAKKKRAARGFALKSSGRPIIRGPLCDKCGHGKAKEASVKDTSKSSTDTPQAT